MAYAGQTLENPVSGEKITFIQTAADTDGELLEIELELSPDGAVPGAHIHPEQEERFEIVEGKMAFRMGLKKIVAGPGDVVTVPAGKIHAFKNAGDETAKVRVQVRPALQMEQLFETTVALAEDGRTTSKGMPKPLRPGALRPPVPPRGQGALPAGADRPRDACAARLPGDAQGPRRALRPGHPGARARRGLVSSGSGSASPGAGQGTPARVRLPVPPAWWYPEAWFRFRLGASNDALHLPRRARYPGPHPHARGPWLRRRAHRLLWRRRPPPGADRPPRRRGRRRPRHRARARQRRSSWPSAAAATAPPATARRDGGIVLDLREHAASSTSTSTGRTAWAAAGLTAGEYTDRGRRARAGHRLRRHRLGRHRRHHARRRGRLPRPQARADHRQPAGGRDRDRRRPGAGASTPSGTPTCSGRSAAAAATSASSTRLPASGCTTSRSSSAACWSCRPRPTSLDRLHRRRRGGARRALDHRQRDARAADAVPARRGARPARSSWRCWPAPATPRPASGRSRRSARWPSRSPTWCGRCPTRSMYPPEDPDYHPIAAAARCSWTRRRRTSTRDDRRATRASDAPDARSRSCACSAARWRACRPTRPPSPTATRGSWSTSPRCTTTPPTARRREAWVDALGERIYARATTAPTSASSATRARRACAPPTRAATWERLAAIKAEYDPDNVFRLNQNVAPG